MHPQPFATQSVASFHAPSTSTNVSLAPPDRRPSLPDAPIAPLEHVVRNAPAPTPAAPAQKLATVPPAAAASHPPLPLSVRLEGLRHQLEVSTLKLELRVLQESKAKLQGELQLDGETNLEQLPPSDRSRIDLLEAAERDLAQRLYAENLPILQELGEIAKSHPTAVRQALCYAVTPAKHSLDAYENKLRAGLPQGEGAQMMATMRALAAHLKQIGKPRLVIINATFEGGGVAELFPTFCSVMQLLGIPVEWHKTWNLGPDFEEGGRMFFDLMQGKHDPKAIAALHAGGDGRPRGKYADVGMESMQLLARALVGIADDPTVGLISLEDAQPLPLAKLFKERNPDVRIAWRCHYDLTGGLSQGKDFAVSLWNSHFLPLLQHCEVVMFQPGSVQSKVLDAAVLGVPPGIDYLLPKNCAKSSEELKAAIADIAKQKNVDIDWNIPHLVMGGRFVAFKGHAELMIWFASIFMQDKSLLDTNPTRLIIFGQTSATDRRKVEYYQFVCDLMAWLQTHHPAIAKRIIILCNLKDNEGGQSQVGDLFQFAGQHEMPYDHTSFKEGCGMMTDEALSRWAAIFTTLSGGQARYLETEFIAHMGVDIEALSDPNIDPTRQWHIRGGKLVGSAQGMRVRDAASAMLRQIIEKHVPQAVQQMLTQRGAQPMTWSEYNSACVQEGRTMMYRNTSMPAMMGTYLGIMAGNADDLQWVREQALRASLNPKPLTHVDQWRAAKGVGGADLVKRVAQRLQPSRGAEKPAP